MSNNTKKRFERITFILQLALPAVMTSRRCNRKDDVINCRVMPKLKTSPNLERKIDYSSNSRYVRRIDESDEITEQRSAVSDHQINRNDEDDSCKTKHNMSDLSGLRSEIQQAYSRLNSIERMI